MGKISRILSVVILSTSSLLSYSQDSSDPSGKQWILEADLNLYFFRDDFFALPVFKADKNKLHLEARYNYEDRETFSGWVGYNFNGGEKVEYTITPMVGGIVGLTDGVAPGLEMRWNYKNFELYSESEYIFNMEANENNFFYNWTDLSYSPKDWLWVGISGQRTRLYQTNLDIQRGLLIGAGVKNWEVNTYLYNIGFDNPFFLLNVSIGF